MKRCNGAMRPRQCRVFLATLRWNGWVVAWGEGVAAGRGKGGTAGCFSKNGWRLKC